VSLASCLAIAGCFRMGLEAQKQPVERMDGDVSDYEDAGPVDEPDADEPDGDADVEVDAEADADATVEVDAEADAEADADIAVEVDAEVDGGDADLDEPVPPCAADMASFLDVDRLVCIEVIERPAQLWIEAEALCADHGRRLCTDAEWVAACHAAPARLESMTGNWEWVADLTSATSARKRGSSTCDSISSHSIDSGAYAFRCCADAIH
jgi:hypothetical protein